MMFLERAKSRGGKYWGDITTKKWQPTCGKEGDGTPARKTTLWGHLNTRTRSTAYLRTTLPTLPTPMLPCPRSQCAAAQRHSGYCDNCQARQVQHTEYPGYKRPLTSASPDSPNSDEQEGRKTPITRPPQSKIP